MPFYTLAFWRGANRNLGQVRAGNYLIVTPDRDAANLLYRFIQDEHKDMIKRASPQYWTFQGNQDIRDVFQGILCGKIAMNDKKFESVRDDFFFHQFQSNDLFGKFPPLPEIPHIDTPDYISGTDFYIRSKCMPHQYYVRRPLEKLKTRLHQFPFLLEQLVYLVLHHHWTSALVNLE